MTPTVIGDAELYLGDCLDVLKTLPENSVDACLTDPPYGLSNHTEADIRRCMAAWLADKPYVHGKNGFMGKAWDSFVPGPELWRELYRVLKPGAHLLVFAGTRTADLMSLALRLAGFECRDTVLYCFGSGFPKASDCGKNIDKMMGKEREVVGADKTKWRRDNDNGNTYAAHCGQTGMITAPATPEAAQWDGWKSSLKPCYEPVLLFRKPLDGTIAETVLKWGTGGLNISACRVLTDDDGLRSGGRRPSTHDGYQRPNATIFQDKTDWSMSPQGRYPGNLILSSDEEVAGCFPVVSGENRTEILARNGKGTKGIYGDYGDRLHNSSSYPGQGSAARFFQHCDFSVEEIAEMHGIEPKRIVYSGKASKRDRDEGCEGMEEDSRRMFASGGRSMIEGQWVETNSDPLPRHNHHATVKPTTLLRYLLKLITPPGCTVIDPFIGSGSTGKAALLEGFRVIGIEREPEYFDIACARVAHVSPEALTLQPSPSVKAEPTQGSLL